MLRSDDFPSIPVVQPKRSVRSISFSSPSGLHSICFGTTADLLGAKVVDWVVSCYSVIDTSMYIGVNHLAKEWEKENYGNKKVSL